MKKILIILFLIIVSVISSKGQVSNNLFGVWKYDEIYEKEKIDEKGLKMAEMFFSDMKFSFHQDKTFHMILMGSSDNGKWKEIDSNSLELRTQKGDIVIVEIVDLNDQKLILKLKNKGAFVLKRNECESKEVLNEEDNDIFSDELFNQPIDVVSASIQSVSKKWYLKRKLMPKKDFSKKQKVIKDELLKDAFIEIFKNGNFNLMIMELSDKGKWRFEENNTKLIFENENGAKYWLINEISDSELVLVKGNSFEKWFFSTKE